MPPRCGLATLLAELKCCDWMQKAQQSCIRGHSDDEDTHSRQQRVKQSDRSVLGLHPTPLRPAAHSYAQLFPATPSYARPCATPVAPACTARPAQHITRSLHCLSLHSPFSILSRFYPNTATSFGPVASCGIKVKEGE